MVVLGTKRHFNSTALTDRQTDGQTMLVLGTESYFNSTAQH